jgi:PEP-CTERM motif
MKRTMLAITLAAAIITTVTAGGAGGEPIHGKHPHGTPPSPPPSGAPPCGVETIVLDLEAPPLKHKKHHLGQELASGNQTLRLVFVNEHHGKHHHGLPPPTPVVVTVPCTNDGAPGGTGAGGIDGAGETLDGTADGGGVGGASGAPGGTNSGIEDIVVDLGSAGPGEPDLGAPDFGALPSGVPDLGTGTEEAVDGFRFVSDTLQFDGSAPEPSTLALLGLGLVGLARRRRHS